MLLVLGMLCVRFGMHSSYMDVYVVENGGGVDLEFVFCIVGGLDVNKGY